MIKANQILITFFKKIPYFLTKLTKNLMISNPKKFKDKKLDNQNRFIFLFLNKSNCQIGKLKRI